MRHKRNKANQTRVNPFEERLALIEIISNMKPKKEESSMEVNGEEKDKDQDAGDDDFQCLDVPTTKIATNPAPVFIKKSDSSKTKKNQQKPKVPSSLTRPILDSFKTCTPRGDSKNENSSLKRASSDMLESPSSKKTCTEIKSTNVVPTILLTILFYFYCPCPCPMSIFFVTRVKHTKSSISSEENLFEV